MKVELSSYQADLLRDLVIEQKAVKSGSTVYGDKELQAEVVMELQEVIDKLGDLL